MNEPPPEVDRGYGVARITFRHAIRDQLQRSLPLSRPELETLTDELLVALTRPSLANVLQVVIAPHLDPPGAA